MNRPRAAALASACNGAVTLFALPDAVPAELTSLPQWVAWRWEERDDKLTKPPLNPHSGGYASSTDPATWSTSEDAIRFRRENPSAAGVGFVNGSFYDWLGESLPVCPEWGKGYGVFPDDQAGEVESLEEARQRARDAIAASPAGPIQQALEESVGYRAFDRNECWDEAMAVLRERLREGTPWCWQELRAVETVLEEVAQEFNGEDPLLPAVRHVLDLTRQELAELPQFLGALDVEVGLPEPDEERVAELRERVLGARQ